MIKADAELTIKADLVVINDELTIEDELLTGLTKLTTDDGLDAVLLIDELTECLTDKLTVFLTVDGFKLVTDNELDAVLFTDELTERLTVDGLELFTGLKLTELLIDELT